MLQHHLGWSPTLSPTGKPYSHCMTSISSSSDLDARARSAFHGARALVTGGAGAIGSNLAKTLLDLGCQVTVLDNLSSGHLTNLEPTVSSSALIRGDVSVERDVTVAFSSEPHFVFHLAAHFANQSSIDHPLEDCQSNAIGTLRVLEACRHTPSLRRFVYASSSCVLGQHHGPMAEDTPFATDTPYAVSKLAGELYSEIYHREFNVPTSVVRYFNVFGPGERPGRYRNVLPNFVQRALWGLPLIITGDGTESREFVNVQDAVRGTLAVATTDAAVGEVFHIGSGDVRTIRELAEAIVEATGKEAPIEYRPRRHWDHIRSRQTSFAKARRVLGYEPQVRFDIGLTQTVNWIAGLDLPIEDADWVDKVESARSDGMPSDAGTRH